MNNNADVMPRRSSSRPCQPRWWRQLARGCRGMRRRADTTENIQLDAGWAAENRAERGLLHLVARPLPDSHHDHPREHDLFHRLRMSFDTTDGALSRALYGDDYASLAAGATARVLGRHSRRAHRVVSYTARASDGESGWLPEGHIPAASRDMVATNGYTLLVARPPRSPHGDVPSLPCTGGVTRRSAGGWIRTHASARAVDHGRWIWIASHAIAARRGGDRAEPRESC